MVDPEQAVHQLRKILVSDQVASEAPTPKPSRTCNVVAFCDDPEDDSECRESVLVYQEHSLEIPQQALF